MNKENIIFILGFFWLIVGGFVAAMRIHEMINGTFEHIWYEYVFLVSGTISFLNGLRMLNSVTNFKISINFNKTDTVINTNKQAEKNGNLPIFSVIERYLMNIKRNAAISYMRNFKDHYVKEANKELKDKEYRRRCLENAIVYENAILQMNCEVATFNYEKAKILNN